jgi:prepilin-type N-terminal cleavage/methylation domain-containing protein
MCWEDKSDYESFIKLRYNYLNMNHKKGFTIIELLMVIAIIGLLSTIVLTSLSGARNRGSDAAVKSNLNSIRSAADLFYDNNGTSYGTFAIGNCVSGSGMFGNSTIISAINAAISAGDGTSRCVSSGTAYAVAVGMKTIGQSWCIDSLGRSKLYLGNPVSAISGSSCN